MAALPAMTPAELAENKGPDIVAANLVVAILATLAVTLRLVARKTQKIGFKSDDILICLALPLSWGMCICTLICVHYGLGRHIETVSAEHLIKEAKVLFASQLIWANSIFLVKASILALYIRIFGPLKYIRYSAYFIGCFVACWSITVILVCSFQCRPLQFLWDKSIRGSCINVWLFSVIGTTLNVVTDFIILVLPFRAVWNLKMATAQKISVMGTLLLGSFTCIISAVRLGELIKENNNLDISWAASYVTIWSTAEPCLGIVAACLPTLRPLFPWFFGQTASRKAGRSSRYLYKNTDSSSGSRPEKILRPGDSDHFVPLTDMADTNTGVGRYNTVITRDFPKRGIEGDEAIDSNAIHVNTTWALTREAM